jgi:predicted DCC family thiol-disulfide oxidoreductase YuxK
MLNLPNKPIILFDGECNLCDGLVQFVIKRDKRGKFMYGALQSEKGQEILKHFGFKTTDFDTFILLDKGHYYTKSTGILRGAAILGGLYQLLYFFIIIPAPIRDFFYNLVARNRYRLFGKKDYCMMPTPELKSRFLE